MKSEAILDALKEFIEEINFKTLELDNSIKEKAEFFISSVKPISVSIFNDAPMSVQETGEIFISRLKEKNKNLNERIDFAIYFLVEVMIERSIRVGTVQTGGPEQLLNYVFDNSKSKSFDVMLRASLGGTVVRIIRHERDLINQTLKDVDGNFKKISDKTTTLLAEKEKIVLQKISEFDERVEKVEGRLGEYIKQVKELQGELSFLVLGKAFTTFINEKAKEKGKLLIALFSIAVLIVSIPIAIFLKEIIWPDVSRIVSENLQSVAKAGPEVLVPVAATTDLFSILSKLFFLLPITVAEIILIFYFRIILGQFNAVNAQLLQLKMRLSICQFIESYVDFKDDNGQHNLERFESLIFSNLMPSAEQVPSTFDGLEHLGKAIASLKK